MAGEHLITEAQAVNPASARSITERLMQLMGGAFSATSGAFNSTLQALRVMFGADLASGVNKHLQVTLTVAETDYTVVLPDGPTILSLYSTDTFRYAIADSPTSPAATKAGNAVAADFGTGARYVATGSAVVHVIAQAAGRTLHLRSATAGAIVHINVA